jgi:hypothetical protein
MTGLDNVRVAEESGPAHCWFALRALTSMNCAAIFCGSDAVVQRQRLNATAERAGRQNATLKTLVGPEGHDVVVRLDSEVRPLAHGRSRM